ncbi:glycosyltransferase family 4 protein [Flavobacterium sp. K5-23]|uniref:MraY family glycosyltransferase n=1 Tax=Flavobacterium sp. K5-23 TaxID=2746225 RepID=UPI00200E5751|nr:glycosyltransferase family 4 protein [Flavobacterium sp. K5-23]UQD56130.1 glycosyltransferase family 4 protein [Flavobacterium sp. K5-23]
MQYVLIVFVLFLLELLYFKIANRYNIIDKPNHRSAHTEITLRGGGIIFWFAALIYFTQNYSENLLFFAGITLVSVVSFWDDILSLPNKIRLLAHFTAISLVFYHLGLFAVLPIWGVILGYVFFIGIINAYNFMDGINGITGVYTLVVLGSLLYVNQYIQEFTTFNLIVYPMLAAVVFLFFNFRKKAKCFAGDIGSIAIAFWVVYLLLELVLKTNSMLWILFLAVYGVDAIITISHRLYLRQNIFEAHRLHFYQILSNEYKIQHRVVALGYGIAQVIASGLVVFLVDKVPDLVIFAIVLVPLIGIYSLKFYLIKGHGER